VAAVAAHERSLALLLVALVVFWAGDSLDGLLARVLRCETRIGACLDILSDRFCAAAFYIGLMWLEPSFAPAVLLYLAEYMVVDCFLSLSFLAWPIRSPNYFYVIDRRLWLLNWSHPGKAVNSSLFAILLVVTGWVWVGVAVAAALLTLKAASLLRLVRIGLPVPAR
jgi:CDP-diacylglycerol--glycerol-3-phosphate 3-phosphatidyltransferase